MQFYYSTKVTFLFAKKKRKKIKKKLLELSMKFINKNDKLVELTFL